MPYLGVNSLFSSILNILNISELGIGQALIYYMYKPVADGDSDQINKLLSLYKRCYSVLGYSIAAIGLIITPFIKNLISGEIPPGINIYIVFLIYLSQTVVGYLAFPDCQAAFSANQDLAYCFKNRAILYLIFSMAQIVCVLFGNNYYLYILVLPIMTLAYGIFDRVGFEKYYPDYNRNKYKKDFFDRQFWTDFYKKIYSLSLSKIRIGFRTSIDTITISMFLGLTPVAQYQNYILVLSVPTMFCDLVLNGVLPSLGNSVAIESKESNYNSAKMIMYILNIVVMLFSAYIICCMQPFMEMWAKRENLLPELTMILFVILFYVRSISKFCDLIRNATGIWWEGRYVAIFETIANIILNIVFVYFWEMDGIIFATIVTIVAINIPLETYYINKYYFEQNLNVWIHMYLKGMMRALAVCLITYILSSVLKNILTIGIWFITIMFVPIALILLISCKDEQFMELYNIVRSILQSRLSKNI